MIFVDVPLYFNGYLEDTKNKTKYRTFTEGLKTSLICGEVVQDQKYWKEEFLYYEPICYGFIEKPEIIATLFNSIIVLKSNWAWEEWLTKDYDKLMNVITEQICKIKDM